MKHLIVYAHPANPQSFNYSVKNALVELSESKGHETVVRDLYEMNFNPVLRGEDLESYRSGNLPEDIKREQEYVTWADLITFVYPIWWVGMPAVLKGYFDRVYSFGFAYAINENGLVKLLNGKKVLIFNSFGNSIENYEQTGMIDALNKTSDVGIFDFSGMEVLHHQHFGSVPYIDDAARSTLLDEAKKVAERFL